MESATVPRPLVKRHHGLVRLAHWLNAIVLLGMIGSGWQIYVGFSHFGIRRRAAPLPNPLDGTSIPKWGRLGGWLAGGLNWHFALAWPFVITGLVYLAFLVLTGEWRALLFRPRDIGPALQMQLYYLRLRKDHPPQGKHNPLQKGAYSFIVILGALSALTGFAIYKPVQLSWDISLRRVRAREVLAFRRGVGLHRIHPAAHCSGVPGRSVFPPGDDHRLVSRQVSEP